MHDPIRPADSDDLPALRAIQTATLAEPWPEMLALGADGPPLLLVYADPDPAGYALAVLGDSDHPATAGSAPDEPDADATSDETDADATSDEPDAGATSGETGDGRDTAPPDAADRPRPRGAYLVELAVAPSRQGEGVGTALLGAVVDRLRERGYDRLDVTARLRDGEAVSFYEGRGFEREARLPDHYESGDGVLLRRPIESA